MLSANQILEFLNQLYLKQELMGNLFTASVGIM